MANIFPQTLPRPFRGIKNFETSGRFAGSLLIADAILCTLVALTYSGFGLNRTLQMESAALFAGIVVGVHLVGQSYAQLWPAAVLGRIGKLIVANVVAGVLLPFALAWLQIDFDRPTTFVILAFFAPLQVWLHLAHQRRRRDVPAESLRWMLAAAGGFSLGYPFLTNNTVGTGDASWYAGMVADFVTQWRSGIFPVFVGQTDYAFNGAVSPLRFAPYLQHVAGILDLATFRTLSFAGLLNLTLFGSLLSAALTAYGSLVAINAGPRWLALGFALLFVSSPGVLALAYTGDLFMSVCALPYLPLALLGIYRSLTVRDTASLCFLAAALSAVWLCHPPIAFWITLVATFAQLVRLVREWREPRAWKSWGAGAALFGALLVGTFVSVGTLHLPPLVVDRLQLIGFVRQAFPDSLLPVSEGAATLSDYQLGWSLWLVLIFAAVAALIRRRTFELILVESALVLVLLLLPIPHVLDALWKTMPQAICNLTFYWPMQRLYVVLASLVVFAGYACAADLARRWWVHLLGGGALLFALQWSWVQAEFFVQRGLLNRGQDVAVQLARLPQNRVLTRYAYSPFPSYPPYFSHGYVDPVWQNRLLESTTFREIDSNFRALTGVNAITRDTGPVVAKKLDEGAKFFELIAPLSVQPGKHYALEFEFRHPALRGSLLVAGATITREYYLPDSSVGLPITGATTAFGALPTSRKSLPLFSSSSASEKLTLQFVSNESVTTDITDFGRFTLREYHPDQLPVTVTSWAPYRAKVTATTAAWVETPRIFIEGYAATVNGKSAAVSRSPDGLVMLAVEAGENQVNLSYPGPLVLRISYFISLLSWIGLGAVTVRSAWRRRTAPA